MNVSGSSVVYNSNVWSFSLFLWNLRFGKYSQSASVKNKFDIFGCISITKMIILCSNHPTTNVRESSVFRLKENWFVFHSFCSFHFFCLWFEVIVISICTTHPFDMCEYNRFDSTFHIYAMIKVVSTPATVSLLLVLFMCVSVYVELWILKMNRQSTHSQLSSLLNVSVFDSNFNLNLINCLLSLSANHIAILLQFNMRDDSRYVIIII